MNTELITDAIQALGEAPAVDPRLLMAPDTGAEVAAVVAGLYAERTGAPGRMSPADAARVAQRILTAYAQDRDQDAYAPEDVAWQVGLMQDYELAAADQEPR
jgi:hypothetical protein